MQFPDRLLSALKKLPPASRYLIAYSGGVDSHVLLHALAALRTRENLAPLHAVHVHHGLSPHADAWAEHCARACVALEIPCVVKRVNARARAGESPEAAARAARYTALTEEVGAGDVVLSAHHQDDQAETLLLQLLRGAGPRGLAGMPLSAPFASGHLARPLLEFTRGELLAYAREHALRWVDDHSNVDERFDRNFVRLRVLPLLRARWPSAAHTIARAAQHCGEAADLIELQARGDVQFIAGEAPHTVRVSALRGLPEARARAALRVWLEDLGLPLPSTEQLTHVMRDAADSSQDAQALVEWPGAQVRRYRDLLYAMVPLPPHDETREYVWDLRVSLQIASVGELQAQRVRGAGIKLAPGESLCVRFRGGGERIRPAGRRESHTLKHLFQEAGVPPWLREREPLLYIKDELAAVAGRWIDARHIASPVEDGMVIQFVHMR